MSPEIKVQPILTSCIDVFFDDFVSVGNENDCLAEECYSDLKQSGRLLSAGTLCDLLSYMEVPYFSEGIMSVQPLKLETLMEKIETAAIGTLFFPVILKSHWQNSYLQHIWRSWNQKDLIPHHLVGLVIDLQARTLEYFDSQGTGVWQESRELLSAPGVAMNDFAAALKNRWKLRVIENRVPHQNDFYSCGLFQAEFARRRLNEGEPFEEISKKGFDPVEEIRKSFFCRLAYRMHPEKEEELSGSWVHVE